MWDNYVSPGYFSATKKKYKRQLYPQWKSILKLSHSRYQKLVLYRILIIGISELGKVELTQGINQ
jgi:hypothetical protein